MYCCGPTVYRDAHVGNLRTFLLSDLVRRVLMAHGVDVKLIQNITDVGHMSEDIENEDKMLAQAKAESIDPFTVARKYEAGFHTDLARLNIEKADAYPRASASIELMLAMIEELISKEFAYVGEDGTVYFSAQAFPSYGAISGNRLDALKPGHRYEYSEDGAKRFHADWALWKNAGTRSEMIWDSPWGPGFPGWHIECSAMSRKYLGETFDIHGGGMDLVFPHHESEIAQSKGSCGHAPVKYWMHNNMITINGRKMGKSLGNFITLKEFFTGSNAILEQAYSPMTIRFFILQAHYRSTLDFSNDALKAAEKAYKRIINGLRTLRQLDYVTEGGSIDAELQSRIEAAVSQAYAGMNDDMNTAVALASLFDLLKVINSLKGGQIAMNALSAETFALMKSTYVHFAENIFGLLEEKGKTGDALNNLMGVIIEDYSDAKSRKDYSTVDRIRAQIKSEGLIIKDSKTGISWDYEE